MTRINQQGNATLVAHASRVLLAASRRNELLFCTVILGKFAIARTRSPARETCALPRLPAATHRGLATLPAEAVGFPLSEHQLEVCPAIQLTRRAL